MKRSSIVCVPGVSSTPRKVSFTSVMSVSTPSTKIFQPGSYGMLVIMTPPFSVVIVPESFVSFQLVSSRLSSCSTSCSARSAL